MPLDARIVSLWGDHWTYTTNSSVWESLEVLSPTQHTQHRLPYFHSHLHAFIVTSITSWQYIQYMWHLSIRVPPAFDTPVKGNPSEFFCSHYIMHAKTRMVELTTWEKFENMFSCFHTWTRQTARDRAVAQATLRTALQGNNENKNNHKNYGTISSRWCIQPGWVKSGLINYDTETWIPELCSLSSPKF